jgi:hypothetical protein
MSQDVTWRTTVLMGGVLECCSQLGEKGFAIVEMVAIAKRAIVCPHQAIKVLERGMCSEC